MRGLRGEFSSIGGGADPTLARIARVRRGAFARVAAPVPDGIAPVRARGWRPALELAMRNLARGFTLMELVVGLGLAIALLLVASAAIGGGLESARAGGARADLLGSLVLAGTKAGLTGTHAVVCPSVDGATCSGRVDWTPGWIVFLDADEDGVADPGERRLQRVPALPGRVHLRTSAGRTRVTFQGNGGNAGSNVTFTLCDGRGPAKARSLVISNAGRLRDAPASADAAAATCPP
jgi:type IV fimbrial biogenesis protein FimT